MTGRGRTESAYTELRVAVLESMAPRCGWWVTRSPYRRSCSTWLAERAASRPVRAAARARCWPASRRHPDLVVDRVICFDRNFPAMT